LHSNIFNFLIESLKLNEHLSLQLRVKLKLRSGLEGPQGHADESIELLPPPGWPSCDEGKGGKGERERPHETHGLEEGRQGENQYQRQPGPAGRRRRAFLMNPGACGARLGSAGLGSAAARLGGRAAEAERRAPRV